MQSVFLKKIKQISPAGLGLSVRAKRTQARRGLYPVLGRLCSTSIYFTPRSKLGAFLSVKKGC